MTNRRSTFDVGIDFEQVLATLSKQIYETPMAYLRENVQNAVDAVRMQAGRDGKSPAEEPYRVDVELKGQNCIVRDNGIGMSEDHLRRYFWTMGASGKRTEEARTAGCVGQFGIGGFANLGVCDELTVISQTAEGQEGTRTRLTEHDIKSAGGSVPKVASEPCSDAAPRGTIVIGHLRTPPDVQELHTYLRHFVGYAEERVYFDGTLVPRETLVDTDRFESRQEITNGPTDWTQEGIRIRGRLYYDEGYTLEAELLELSVNDRPVRVRGVLRFENGAIDVFRRGFKICATKVETQIGVSGRIDCDRLSPTAGRDSLDADSASLLSKMVNCLERVAVEAVLGSPDLIAQHTRVFPYVLRMAWTGRLDNVSVPLADGRETVLGRLRAQAAEHVGVFFAKQQKLALSQIMQARGNVVVLLPADRHKQKAICLYLESNCSAKPLEGMVECAEPYSDLSRFEQFFLSELELNIDRAYSVRRVQLLPGKLTEDIPVFITDEDADDLEIYVDVRHPEITKLQALGIGPLLYSMVAAFCREYLGPTLRKRSPKFFGSGAINLDLLARRRSELWVLVKDEIEVISKTRQRDVVRASDVQTVKVGAQEPPESEVGMRKPKLLHIVGDSAFSDILGYYMRLPEGAVRAYGDVIGECDNRACVWAGNKITFVASDAVSTSFQLEVRLDHLILTPDGAGGQSVEGAVGMVRPLQQVHDGLYFPVPPVLEHVLVPEGDMEIPIEVMCELIDMEHARAWLPRATPK